MKKFNLSEDFIVADVLNRWPETVPVLLNRQMGCVGCTMAPFEILADVANNYRLRCDRLIGELEDAINRRWTG